MERIKAAVELAKADRARLSGASPPVRAPGPRVTRPPALSNQESDAVKSRVHLDPAHLKTMRLVAHDAEDRRGRVFEMLRTQVIRKMTDSHYQTIGISSPTSGCGKTFTAINLALSIALLPGRSVTLVDLDLRRPHIADCLGLKPGAGMERLLRGEARVDDIIVEPDIGMGRLRVVPTYRASRNPAVQMVSQELSEMVQELRAKDPGGLIMFDLPPVLVADDVISFSPQLDCILLVAAAGQTTAGDISNSERLLGPSEESRGVPEILGIVLNMAEQSGELSYYG